MNVGVHRRYENT